MHNVGDEYELPNKKHVKLLEAVGRILRVPVVISAPVKKEVKKPEFTALDVKAEKATENKPTAKKKSKRTYKRKDIVAE